MRQNVKWEHWCEVISRGIYGAVDIYSRSNPETTPSPFVMKKQPSLLIMSLYSLQPQHNLLTYQNKRLKQSNKQTHTHTHLIRACLTAPSQCTMEPCWHGPAWGMGRSEVYDCADVNDIIQILNQAARFQPSGSSLLAVSLENLTWTPAAEQSNCCRQEWSGLPRLKTTDSWPQTDSQNKSDLSVCPSTHPSVYSVF